MEVIKNIEREYMQINENSYIPLFRSLINWEWFSDSNTLQVWIYLLLSANWKDAKYKGVDVPTGALVTTYEKLSKVTGQTINQIRTSLKHLESTGEISKKITGKAQLIYIEKWSDFNCIAKELNREITGKPQDDNRMITGWQEKEKEAKSKRIENKEIREEIKNKEYIDTGNNMYSPSIISPLTDDSEAKEHKKGFVKPTPEEVQDYISLKGYTFSAEEFIAFYESNGWKVGRNPMKSWKAACTTWQSRERANPKPNKGKSWMNVAEELERKLQNDN